MRGYSHLSDDEREQIGLLKALGHSIGAIARTLRRPKSTISRELSRNRLPSGRYSPLHAAGAYQLRRRGEALIEKDRDLRSFVLDRLAEGWTPEQIAGWLKAGNERRVRAVGCETIYAFIYRAGQKAEQLWRYLTRRHNRRRPRRSRPSRDTIKDRVSIHERPENIDARTEAGHWEGDLIFCKRTRPAPSPPRRQPNRPPRRSRGWRSRYPADRYRPRAHARGRCRGARAGRPLRERFAHLGLAQGFDELLCLPHRPGLSRYGTRSRPSAR